VEIEDHPWFLACQFHPEFKSKPLKPHPLFVSFIQAAAEYKARRNGEKITPAVKESPVSEVQ
jgi:CTP synthase